MFVEQPLALPRSAKDMAQEGSVTLLPRGLVYFSDETDLEQLWLHRVYPTPTWWPAWQAFMIEPPHWCMVVYTGCFFFLAPP